MYEPYYSSDMNFLHDYSTGTTTYSTDYNLINVSPFPDPTFIPTDTSNQGTTEDRRAEHNAVERERRKKLNNRFQLIADALPNVQTHRRPSKAYIIEKALEWVCQSKLREEDYQNEIRYLHLERRRLLHQLSLFGRKKPRKQKTVEVMNEYKYDVEPTYYHQQM
ncbi:hypothetical protein BDB01DRAFT_881744 [Pilobolus umbonatus]|nr:hypothetical protein BDB01DRAFT_881744 [Pilobolus umbonatus]